MRPPRRIMSRTEVVAGTAMCLVVLVVAVVALTSRLDSLGTPAALMLIVIAIGGMWEIASSTRQ